MYAYIICSTPVFDLLQLKLTKKENTVSTAWIGFTELIINLFYKHKSILPIV